MSEGVKLFKNKNLAFQIWAMFVILMIIIFIILSLTFRYILGSFFTNDIYERIEDAQQQFLMFQEKNVNLPLYMNEENPKDEKDMRISNVVISNHPTNNNMNFPPFFNKELIEKQAKLQKEESKQYSLKDKGSTVYYILTKIDDGYLITFSSPNMKSELTADLFNRLIYFMLFLFVMSFPFSVILAKRLTKPLVEIEQHVNSLANRKWDTPLILNRKDEVGNLALSVEKLRKRLIKHDEKQQTFLQHMSHELKTPIMIIQSYIQAIEDGIYPKGDFQSTVKVVQTEVERLNKRVQSLIYLTKLNYLEVEKLNLNLFNIDSLLYETIDKFNLCRKDIYWNLDIDSSIPFMGDREQFEILFENLLQNQIRYAKSNINISMKATEEDDSKLIEIKIGNDGEKILLDNLDFIFEPFYKGEKGQFGLGLSIVKNIINLHHGNIKFENLEDRVQFTMTFIQKNI